VTIIQILQIQVPLLTKRIRKRRTRTREKTKKMLRIIMIQQMMELRET